MRTEELGWGAITISQTVFSLNAGVRVVVLFRGIIMAVLGKVKMSVRRASIIQIVTVGLAHFKGIVDFWSVADFVSVVIIWFLFHFLHDAGCPRAFAEGLREDYDNARSIPSSSRFRPKSNEAPKE